MEDHEENHNLLSTSRDWQQKFFHPSSTSGSTNNGGSGSGTVVAALASKEAELERQMNQRANFEKQFPPDDLDRIQQAVAKLQTKRLPTKDAASMNYDIDNCPSNPPPGYPIQWPLASKIIGDWNPDDTNVPNVIYDGICRFDWNKPDDQIKVETYRQAEQPFVLMNHPEVMRTTERWNHPSYLQDLIGSSPIRNDFSKTNHQMFWRLNPFQEKPKGWDPPTETKKLSFEAWMKKAQEMETTTNNINHKDKEHWYFRLNAKLSGENEYIFKELPMFHPRKQSMFMVDTENAPGINCRFGMKGVVAELHFDITRNWILVMGGQRRYILAHPNQCSYMELYKKDHPSARHSSVDWANPPIHDPNRPFNKAMANEVVLQPGDALYLPTAWFHFIVSLNINYQCNARSGITKENFHHLAACGFPGKEPKAK